jgi:hypothetical protein
MTTTHREHPGVEELQLGEDPDSGYVGDARHWFSLYTELLRLVDDAVIDLGREHLLSRTELDGYSEVFRRRRAFWQLKMSEHEAPAVITREGQRREHASSM